MSEPRKLYTAGATGSSEQEQYEAARRRAHPHHIVISPLDIDGMMLHQRIHDHMRIRTSVKNISYHMKMVYDQTADQITKCYDQLRCTSCTDHGMDDLIIVCLLIRHIRSSV